MSHDKNRALRAAQLGGLRILPSEIAASETSIDAALVKTNDVSKTTDQSLPQSGMACTNAVIEKDH